jgi:hypothetical protein
LPDAVRGLLDEVVVSPQLDDKGKLTVFKQKMNIQVNSSTVSFQGKI